MQLTIKQKFKAEKYRKIESVSTVIDSDHPLVVLGDGGVTVLRRDISQKEGY